MHRHQGPPPPHNRDEMENLCEHLYENLSEDLSCHSGSLNVFIIPQFPCYVDLIINKAGPWNLWSTQAGTQPYTEMIIIDGNLIIIIFCVNLYKMDNRNFRPKHHADRFWFVIFMTISWLHQAKQKTIVTWSDNTRSLFVTQLWFICNHGKLKQ